VVKPKHPGGRPTKFTKEIKDRTVEYLKDCLENKKIPSVARLAVILNVSKNSLYNWGEEDPEFLNTLEQLKQIQESMLLENGLEGTYNATIVKLMLSNYGYREKSEQDIRVKELPQPILGGISAIRPDNGSSETTET